MVTKREYVTKQEILHPKDSGIALLGTGIVGFKESSIGDRDASAR
jgi:hypothetical protein